MSNGKLMRDCNNYKRNVLKKQNSKDDNNKKTTKGLKNSTANNVVDERSTKIPWEFEKKIDIWCTEEGQIYLESWASDGLTDEQIAKKMGIVTSTFYTWCNKEKAIKRAVMRGRDFSNMQVENTLYKCAMGYTYEEEAVTKDGTIVKIQRYAQPSAEAQKFILTNRRKDKWKSKQEVMLEAQAQVQANVQAETKVITAEDIAKSIIGDEDLEDFNLPSDEVIKND